MTDARLTTAKASAKELLAFEVARNAVGMKLPVEELLPALGVTQEEFLVAAGDPTFCTAVRAYKKEMEDNGVSFRLRAAIIAEDGLKELYDLINDKDEPAATRLKALEKAVEWGDLAPTTAGQGVQGLNGPTIVFNFPPGVGTAHPVLGAAHLGPVPAHATPVITYDAPTEG